MEKREGEGRRDPREKQDGDRAPAFLLKGFTWARKKQLVPTRTASRAIQDNGLEVI